MLKLGELNELETCVILVRGGFASSLREARGFEDVVVIEEPYVPPNRGIEYGGPREVFISWNNIVPDDIELESYTVVQALNSLYWGDSVMRWWDMQEQSHIRYVISPSFGTVKADRAYTETRRLMRWAQDVGEAHPEAIEMLRGELEGLLEEIRSQIPNPNPFWERQEIEDLPDLLSP